MVGGGERTAFAHRYMMGLPDPKRHVAQQDEYSRQNHQPQIRSDHIISSRRSQVTALKMRVNPRAAIVAMG